jgi:hypothetical protein
VHRVSALEHLTECLGTNDGNHERLVIGLHLLYGSLDSTTYSNSKAQLIAEAAEP